MLAVQKQFHDGRAFDRAAHRRRTVRDGRTDLIEHRRRRRGCIKNDRNIRDLAQRGAVNRIVTGEREHPGVRAVRQGAGNLYRGGPTNGPAGRNRRLGQVEGYVRNGNHVTLAVHQVCRDGREAHDAPLPAVLAGAEAQFDCPFVSVSHSIGDGQVQQSRELRSLQHSYGELRIERCACGLDDHAILFAAGHVNPYPLGYAVAAVILAPRQVEIGLAGIVVESHVVAGRIVHVQIQVRRFRLRKQQPHSPSRAAWCEDCLAPVTFVDIA